MVGFMISTQGNKMRKLRIKGVKLSKKALAMYHYIPSAYCIAKPAEQCATFIFDPVKGKIPSQPGISGSQLIQNESVTHCVVGNWYQLGYLVFGTGTMWWEVL